MSGYGWIITKDHVFDPELLPDDKSDVGVAGPRGLSRSMFQQLKDGAGFAFRMKDDDGELYYEGRFLGDADEACAPLEDFGMPNAGATSIEYPRKPEWNCG